VRRRGETPHGSATEATPSAGLFQQPAKAATVVALVGAVTAAMLWDHRGPASVLRHLYVLPTAWAAVAFGRIGGVATAALVALVTLPPLLRAIEATGLTAQAVETIVTLAGVLAIGALAGGLADRARRHVERYEAVLALQRSIGAGTPLREGIALANRTLRRLLRADSAEIVVRRDDGSLVDEHGVRTLPDGSVGARVDAAGGRTVVRDPAGDTRAGRSLRAAAARLVAGDRVIGLVGAARATDFSRDEQAALEALGMQVALALDNARLGIELETKVAAATRELRELDRAKSELVSIASHELRTPLTSLRGFSELLLARRYAEDDSRKFVGVIHNEAARLGRLLDNLLDVARLERGQRIELRPVPVDVGRLLEGCAELFRAQGADRRFTVAVHPLVPELLVDRDAMERVLSNLVSNAVKYSPPATEVRLTAAPDSDDHVLIAVEDEGPGIPDAERSHIFELYYRVSRPGSAVGGLGLGLALVKALVEASGGSVGVECAQGKGSRFTVSLPAAPGVLHRGLLP
jgi:signal transduction histidine kinase